jgi:hypothetical protein
MTDTKQLAGLLRDAAKRLKVDPTPSAYFLELVGRLEAAADELEAREPVATVLPPDPYDERDGLWLSNADMKRLKALPSGTKLYATPPAPQVPKPFMDLFTAAHGLSFGADWNRGTHAQHYRRALVDAAAECKKLAAPQPDGEGDS